MRHIFYFVCFILLVGCTSTPTPTQENYEKYLNSWIGETESKLINEIGVPTSHYDLQGKKYILYSKTNTVLLPGQSPSYYAAGSGYTHPIGGSSPIMVSFSCETTFIIQSGIIKAWKIKGNGCKM